MMTPEAFVIALQESLGERYEVGIHPVVRQEPQFNVFPSPREFDAKGGEYRVTFSIRADHLDEFDERDVMAYAERAAADLAVQKVKGQAPPAWRP